jgi:hypothetical protein
VWQTVEPSGTVVANSASAQEAQTFHVHKLGNKKVHFKAHHGKYLCVDPLTSKVMAKNDTPKDLETFEFHKYCKH